MDESDFVADLDPAASGCMDSYPVVMIKSDMLSVTVANDREELCELDMECRPSSERDDPRIAAGL